MDENTKDVMFSNKTDLWETPQDFYDKLNKRFGPFTLDPACNKENAKCAKFYTEEDDGLSKSWRGETVFLNCPYSKTAKWMKKSYEETKDNYETKVVMLVASRTDTRHWHDFAMKSQTIYFVKGRLKFGCSKHPAPFASAVIVFSRWKALITQIETMER